MEVFLLYLILNKLMSTDGASEVSFLHMHNSRIHTIVRYEWFIWHQKVSVSGLWHVSYVTDIRDVFFQLWYSEQNKYLNYQFTTNFC